MQGKTSTQQLREYMETKKGKTYFIGIITMVTITVMLVFAVVPAIKSITDKMAQNKVRREYLTALTTKEESIKQLLSQEDQSQEKIQLLNTSLPDKRNDEYVLANINEMALLNHNTMISIDFGVDTPAKLTTSSQSTTSLRQVPITMSVQGEISSLGIFIKKLEEFPTIIAIEDISFSNKNIQMMNLSPNKGDTVLSLKVNYYYYQNASK